MPEENLQMIDGLTIQYVFGNSAGKIAESLGLDVDKAKTLGYIHDIGKLVRKV